MAKKLSEVVLQYNIDQSRLNRVYAQTERLRKIVQEIGGDANDTAKDLSAMFDEVQSGINRATAIKALTTELYAMQDALGGARKTAEALVENMQALGATKDEISGALNELARLQGTVAQADSGGGLTQSIFSKVQRAAGGVGLGGVAEIAGFADDFSDLAGALSAAGIAVGPLVAALAPLVAVTGLVAAGFVAVTKVFRDGAEDIDKAVDALQVYYDTIGEGTTESINAQIDAINKQKALDRQFLDQIVATQNELRTNTGDAVTDVSKTLVSIFGASGLQTKADELAGKIQKADESLVGLNLALGSNAVAVNDTAAAYKASEEATRQAADEAKRQADEAARIQKDLLDKQTDQQAEQIRKRIALDAQLDQLKATGTSKDVAQQAQAVNELAIQREKELNALYALPNQTASTTKQIEELELELQLLDYQSARLEGDIKKTVDARQAELDAYAALQKSVKDLSTDMTDAASRAGKLAKGVLDAVNEAGQKRSKAEQDAAADIAHINEQANERRASLEKRYADSLISITENAVQSAEKALQKLQDAQASLRRDLGRANEQAERKLADDQLIAQIDAQREETQALQDHLRNLQKIRADAQDREFELAANRDFAGLFFSRRDTNKQLNSANSDFNAERGQRQTELQQKLTDLAQQAAIERRERQIQFEQRLADNRAQYSKEVVEIEANRQAQLTKTRAQYAADQAELASALAKQLVARRQAYRTEIDEINKAVALRLRIELQAQSALVQGAQRAAGVIGSLFSAVTSGFGKPVKRAGGGGLSAGMSAFVNEPFSTGGESFRTGGKSYAFPGPGLFLASQGGSVDSGKGKQGAVINMPITVNGAGNPQATAKYISDKVVENIDFIFNKKGA